MDFEILKEIDKKVEDNTININKILLKIVEDNTKELDAIVFEIKERIKQPYIIDEDTLEKYSLELASELYYVGQLQEFLGLRFDMSKELYKEAYDKSFIEATGTINDKNAFAESHTFYESVEKSINERAYKRIKNKIENATELLNAIKKIISRRIAEIELSRQSNKDVILSKQSFNIVGNRNSPTIKNRKDRK